MARGKSLSRCPSMPVTEISLVWFRTIVLRQVLWAGMWGTVFRSKGIR